MTALFGLSLYDCWIWWFFYVHVVDEQGKWNAAGKKWARKMKQSRVMQRSRKCWAQRIKSARFFVRMVKNGKLRVTIGQMEATIGLCRLRNDLICLNLVSANILEGSRCMMKLVTKSWKLIEKESITSIYKTKKGLGYMQSQIYYQHCLTCFSVE